MKCPLFVTSLLLAGFSTGAAQQSSYSAPVRFAQYNPLPNAVEAGTLPPPRQGGSVERLPPVVESDAFLRQADGVTQSPPSAYGQGAGAATSNCACQDCASCGIANPRLARMKGRLQASHWGYADEFCPRPFGSYTEMALAAQICNGIAAQRTLYRYDFAALDGLPSARLNTTGLKRLHRLALTMCDAPYTLYIEGDPQHPEINERRRQTVLAQLQRINPEVVDEQVLVRIPAAYGLRGEEGLILQRTLLRQTESRGSSGGSSQGSYGTSNYGGGSQSGASGYGSSGGSSRPY